MEFKFKDIERFNKFIDKSGDCWDWKGYYHKGYARFHINNRIYNSCKIAYYLYHGYYPSTIHHTCENAICCNPYHIKEGIKINGGAKLTWDQVRDMRNQRKKGATLNELAKTFNITDIQVSRICRNKAWVE